MSFGRAARNTLLKLTGSRVSESTVQRVKEDASEQPASDWRQTRFGPMQCWPWEENKTGQTCAYTSLDSVSVPQQPRTAAFVLQTIGSNRHLIDMNC